MAEEQNAEEQSAGTNTAPESVQGTTAEDQGTTSADTSWVPKRIGEITAARRAAEARAEQLARENAELQARLQSQGQGTDNGTGQRQHQDFDALVQAAAQRMISQQSQQADLNSKAIAIEEAGRKAFGQDFDASIQNLQQAGIGSPEFLRAVTSIPEAERLITWLGKPENLNDAMRLVSLDPVAMGIEMMKLNTKAAQALSKPVSKAPPPIDPIDKGSATGGGDEPPANSPEWFKWRQKQVAARRQGR
jgi:hypothetical protein